MAMIRPRKWVKHWMHLINPSLRQTAGELRAILEDLGYLEEGRPTTSALQSGVAEVTLQGVRWNRIRFHSICRDLRRASRRPDV